MFGGGGSVARAACALVAHAGSRSGTLCTLVTATITVKPLKVDTFLMTMHVSFD